MNISRQVTIEQRAATVWLAMQDLSLVASCLPGAKLDHVDDEGVHTGTVDVRLGPASLSFAGKAKIVELEPDQRRLTLDASGKERRGRGGVNTTIAATVKVKAESVATIEVTADIDLYGPAAQLGRRGGILEDVSDELIEQFVANLKRAIGQEVVPGGGPRPTSFTAGSARPGHISATRIDEDTGLWGYLPMPGVQTSTGWPVLNPPEMKLPGASTGEPVACPRADNELSGIKFAVRILRRRANRWVRARQRVLINRRKHRKAS